MRLKWIEHAATRDIVDKRRYLVDEESDRCYGYVEDPGSYHLCFEARPYHSEDRFYLSLSTAQGYLEQAAIEKAASEREQFKPPAFPPAGLRDPLVPERVSQKWLR